ncbi:amidohydrolase family protein [Neptunitalea lumnitzerae]|uniref:Periplasmic amidohydrolase n=1 Tax=Neptunitalea lumnitzerae TaxID=2965509 RepID=A0ABQ5MKF7_9FLAO|nr:amidohydrolase family protein [Neptunitalea sp. Y10]GLB49892.1 periplasmic amidohydrolase [Neptunitalea sp. Y10]
MKKILLFIFLCLHIAIYAQEYFPKNDGVKTTDNAIVAFTNATIYVSPSEIIKNGTLLIQKGKVLNVGASISIPKNAVQVDLKDKYIYPSFIDMYSNFGVNTESLPKDSNQTLYDANREGYYWNDHIRPDQSAIEVFNYDNAKAKEYIKNGFGIVSTHVNDGIVQGTGTLIALNNFQDNNLRILDQKSAQYFSFKKSKRSKQSYPTSRMGAIALLRQFYYDTDWYNKGNSNSKDLAIEAFLENKGIPQIFDAEDRKNALRADKIAKEFKQNYILKGGGDEYQRIDEIVNTKASFIIPLDFPDAYDVSNPYIANKIALSDMLYWNQAPTNPKVLEEHQVNFALTASENKKVDEFFSNLQSAISYGLSETKALEALTTVPAKLLGKQNEIGVLKKGYIANFLITSGPIFDKETTIYENWVQGNANILSNRNTIDISGDYVLTIDTLSYTMHIKGSPEKPALKLMKDSLELKSKITYQDGWVNIFFNSIDADSTKTEYTRLTGLITDTILKGNGNLPNGKVIAWTATKKKTAEHKANKKNKTEKNLRTIMPVTFPNMAYGFDSLPKQQRILFKNATVWTNEEEGILKETDVLVNNGKIEAIGKDLSATNAIVIDAKGKHLTSGIIDEHSHIGTDAVNEAGQNSSAEVSIQDVLNPEDINLYRNLSGGVTTIQILHGSANPIGGQSAIIKPRWGVSAQELLLENASPFIKFALGENVKQSNWGGGRFPQSRMGVEQVFIDYFQRAKEYDQKWNTYKSLSKKEKAKTNAPRYDIELETLAQIINKERFITCHSYVQSEINMLMKVADLFDFNVNTFTHILEGYKVADKMKAHGVGGSTFADWWAYKFEVNDAIPYNAAIMHDAGIVVAINSDDAEMSRRLNQEAAKTIKYGGMTEEEAWKMVTINPAKLLHLDDSIGSIKVGKDADIVLWSDNPLSIYAIAEKTMIEGVIYYDYETMEQMKKEIEATKNTLINQMLEAKNKGMKTQAPKEKKKELMHCDTL